MINSDDALAMALRYTTKMHEGQFRIQGTPYIVHPVAVARILKDRGYDVSYQMAGLFHDLLEDTDATEEEIKAMGGPEVLEAVKLVTKHEGYVMEEYVRGIRNNPMAMAVKAADRLHNLLDAVNTSERFKRRYIKESMEWYVDFMPEIPDAIIRLNNSLSEPMELAF